MEVFFKKLFLKFLQNSQENNCVGVSFYAPLTTLLKQRLQHRCFPVNFCKVFKNIHFKQPPTVAASFHHQMQNLTIFAKSSIIDV